MIGTKQQKIVRYHVSLKKKNMVQGRCRIVFLTDMHNCIWHPDNRYLLEKIDAENPDLVLCGGDMLVAHPGVSAEPAIRFMQELSRRHRVYYALGNHEYRLRLYPETYGDAYDRYMDALAGSDIVFLDNDSVKLELSGMPVHVYGLSIGRKYYRRFSHLKMPVSYIQEKIGAPDARAVNILLAHTPHYLPSYFRWGADLILSGHYHGGVMQLKNGRGLLNPDPAIFPYGTHGSFSHGGRTAVVSAGLGEHTIPVRIRNPRELSVVDVSVNG